MEAAGSSANSNRVLSSQIYGYSPATGAGTTLRNLQERPISLRNPKQVVMEGSATSNDEVICLQDAGKTSLFPCDPFLGEEFKNYLKTLSKSSLKSLLENAIDKRITEMPNQAGGDEVNRPMSYNMVTQDDFKELEKERNRIIATWPKEFQDNLGYKPNSEEQQSVEIFAVHQFLMCHIIGTKYRCMENHLKENQQGSIPNFEFVKRATLQLYWQFNMQKELYRKTLMTPYMKKKRFPAVPPYLKTVSSSTKRNSDGHITSSGPTGRKSSKCGNQGSPGLKRFLKDLLLDVPSSTPSSPRSNVSLNRSVACTPPEFRKHFPNLGDQ